MDKLKERELFETINKATDIELLKAKLMKMFFNKDNTSPGRDKKLPVKRKETESSPPLDPSTFKRTGAIKGPKFSTTRAAGAAKTATAAKGTAGSGGPREEGSGCSKEGAGTRDEATRGRKEGTGSVGEGTGSMEEGAGTREEASEGRKEGAGTREQETGSSKEGAGTREEGAGSSKEGAGTREEASGSRMEGTGTKEEASGGRKEGAEGRKEGAGIREESTGGSKEGARTREEEAGSSKEGAGTREEASRGRKEGAWFKENPARGQGQGGGGAGQVQEGQGGRISGKGHGGGDSGQGHGEGTSGQGQGGRNSGPGQGGRSSGQGQGEGSSGQGQGGRNGGQGQGNGSRQGPGRTNNGPGQGGNSRGQEQGEGSSGTAVDDDAMDTVVVNNKKKKRALRQAKEQASQSTQPVRQTAGTGQPRVAPLVLEGAPDDMKDNPLAIKRALEDGQNFVSKTITTKNGIILVFSKTEEDRKKLLEIQLRDGMLLRPTKASTATRKVTPTVVILGVNPDLTDDDLTSELERTCKRIMSSKQNGAPTWKVRLECQSEEDQAALLRAGVNIGHQHYKVTAYVIKKPVLQCYRCQGFNHVASACKSEEEKCRRCGGNHNSKDCKSETIVCTNCAGPHLASDFGCPLYRDETTKRETSALSYASALTKSGSQVDCIRLACCLATALSITLKDRLNNTTIKKSDICKDVADSVAHFYKANIKGEHVYHIAFGKQSTATK